MIIEILNQQLGDEVALSSSRKERTVPDESTKDSQPILKQVLIPKKFEQDIMALQGYVGESAFKPGLVISLSLQELLKIVKRDRQRADAYNSLVRYLSEEMSIKLIIFSQKSKKT